MTMHLLQNPSKLNRPEPTTVAARMYSISTLLAVLLISFAVSTSVSNAASRAFFAPALDGQRIAFCLQSDEECGKPVADAWCELQGFEEALLFERDLTAALHVLHMDTGRSCSGEVCIGFRQIKCS